MDSVSDFEQEIGISPALPIRLQSHRDPAGSPDGLKDADETGAEAECLQ